MKITQKKKKKGKIDMFMAKRNSCSSLIEVVR